MGVSLVRTTPRYSAILVHAGGRTSDDRLTADSLGLANAFGARLLGVTTPCVSHKDLSAAEKEATQIVMEAAGEQFRIATSQVHAGALWRTSESTPMRGLLAFAWAADLIILDLGLALYERRSGEGIGFLLSRSRQAVLIRTDVNRRLSLKRALIIWDESSACSRAIHSALPLLSRSHYVVIIPAKQSYLRSASRVLGDLERGLKIRGIPVQTVGERTCDPNDTIDDYVRVFEPDVLVMSGSRHWGQPSIDQQLSRYKTFAMVSL